MEEFALAVVASKDELAFQTTRQALPRRGPTGRDYANSTKTGNTSEDT